MPVFTWGVLLPGEDLPRQVTTDYVLSDGDEITVNGQQWVVERIEIDADIDPHAGIVSVIPPQEPGEAR